MTETTQGASEAPGDPAADAAALIGQIFGGTVAQILNAVAALSIADHLADGPRTAEEVAGREGSHPRATFRLMRAAASLGVLSYEGGRRFGLTGRGRLLRSGVPGSLRAFAMLQAGHAQWQALGLFSDAVRQGASQTRNALGTDTFDYYTQPENAGEAALFAEAMTGASGLVIQGAIAALDTAGVTDVVDVGGGEGQFVLDLMAADPGLRGQVLDLPYAAERARQEADKRGLSGRFTAVAGDFFAEVPAADLYLLKTVLHDWHDDQATAILRNCRAAANDGGRALVVETVIGETGSPDSAFATIADMSMLCVTGGTERDLDEFDALFAASGWRRGETYPVGGGFYRLELDAA
jgi:hypothetical protein